MTWRKSTYSGQEADCVEVALAQVVRIRDTKDRPGGTLEISTRSWDALLVGLGSQTESRPTL
ncbi:DUF397 domain-containing protein [Amycolatopsis sp. OK19-0408]|uniref:DUF397 domain-containing protein n=1 Tax=Amycolatopsis iheyensis TaxID=2945988 RepID=A0A9X2NG41_9PSEU|nr:DUF397 domain-containing protein [Amycolatopsis iheyensis]MCR6487078.1 DUF397 domain-containing protein [Amycolatopsis iheyensis]